MIKTHNRNYLKRHEFDKSQNGLPGRGESEKVSNGRLILFFKFTITQADLNFLGIFKIHVSSRKIVREEGRLSI